MQTCQCCQDSHHKLQSHDWRNPAAAGETADACLCCLFRAAVVEDKEPAAFKLHPTQLGKVYLRLESRAKLTRTSHRMA